MIFSPRPCQQPMIDIMTRLPRCNVFASPGTGKTSATLASLDSLAAIGDEVFPVLIAAPLRVANVVWDEEIAKWSRFNGLRVCKILGPKSVRETMLATPADVYTINPANLQWLHAAVGSTWPFKTVVVDESTSIKNHRVHFRKSKKGVWGIYVSGKSKNARSLVCHAPKTDRWVNLTGTPTPTGVENLWGQCWPIDFGKALGRTHTAFERRWFRPTWGAKPEENRIEPLPGAKDEILERIKPFSVSIDAYDYFDIDRPVEVDMVVPLPARARELYDAMHNTSVIELRGLDAVGANKGAALMKCRQIASGHLRDVDDEWHHIHDAKLEALQELREKLDGAPLLVSYYFKEDAKDILARFPEARVLSSGKGQREIETAWNEGRLPMLLVHPGSAGHGLNLQWGGNNICIYTMDWNAEHYDQVIERIGPTRQAQSGLNRSVYVHRLLAERTWDQVIAGNLRKKFKVSALVKEALAVLQ